MLHCQDKFAITGFSYDDEGKVNGVKCGEYLAKAKIVVCDGMQAEGHVKSTGKIIRVVCILKDSVPTIKAESAQIILPQRQTGRKNDIFISLAGPKHKICPKGAYVAIISTRQETDNDLKELDLAFRLIG